MPDPSVTRFPPHAEMLHVLWIRDHRGALSELARKLQCSSQFVTEVFWGRKRSDRVERELVFLVRNGSIFDRRGRKRNG